MEKPLCDSIFIGIDRNDEPLRLELYSDILNAIGCNIITHNKENYFKLSSETKKYNIFIIVKIYMKHVVYYGIY